MYSGKGRCASVKNLGAYRVSPSAFEANSWAIVFCPLFFAQKYLNRLTEGGPKQLEDLYSLISFEHILAHEMLHCNIIGTKKPIVDLKGNIPGQKDQQDIYGPTLCHEWAWAYDRGPVPGGVNIKTALNADNYA